MRKFFPVEELARDERFTPDHDARAQADPRSSLVGEADAAKRPNDQPPHARAGPTPATRARSLMHGIFVGEIQALEGAGRTCHDFETRRRAQPPTRCRSR